MRSKLFVSGARPELFQKGLYSAADGLSFDLEDAVLAEHKAEARAAVGDALQSPDFGVSPKTFIVRINGIATSHFAADLDAVVCARLDLVNLPKAESADDVRALGAALSQLERDRGLTRAIRILVNIESPRALRCAAEIASADARVAGLQLGLGDLLEPLGIDRTDTVAVRQVQLAVRLAAGEAGVWACDSAYAAIDDLAGYQVEAIAAKRLGYVGKTCLHSSQVACANDVFRPNEAEVSFAKRVLAAAQDPRNGGAGSFVVDGRMIDEPFIRRAKAVIAMARTMAVR